MNETDIYKKNIADLQEQLQKSYIKIKDLNKKVNKLNKLLSLLLGKVE
jgi:predicted RNase H-like nuclease (RuvC/YqgF family)